MHDEILSRPFPYLPFPVSLPEERTKMLTNKIMRSELHMTSTTALGLATLLRNQEIADMLLDSGADESDADAVRFGTLGLESLHCFPPIDLVLNLYYSGSGGRPDSHRRVVLQFI